jgi:hypothetical protein
MSRALIISRIVLATSSSSLSQHSLAVQESQSLALASSDLRLRQSVGGVLSIKQTLCGCVSPVCRQLCALAAFRADLLFLASTSIRGSISTFEWQDLSL